jgi:hypothetical protein
MLYRICPIRWRHFLVSPRGKSPWLHGGKDQSSEHGVCTKPLSAPCSLILFSAFTWPSLDPGSLLISVCWRSIWVGCPMCLIWWWSASISVLMIQYGNFDLFTHLYLIHAILHWTGSIYWINDVTWQCGEVKVDPSHPHSHPIYEGRSVPV